MDSRVSLRSNGHTSHTDRFALNGNGAPPNNHQSVAQLRRVLSVMFPSSYIRLYHLPPNSVCSLFSVKQVGHPPSDTTNQTGLKKNEKKSSQQVASFKELGLLTRYQKQDDDHDNGNQLWSSEIGRVKFEPSTEPSSRVQVLHLQEQLAESLAGHKAKPVGLCPVRRAIYDQCFDELIRQVTVGCIEQGSLLFRIRNELRMTVSCYRRLYESAIGYGLSKSFGARLQTFSDEDSNLKPPSSSSSIGQAKTGMIPVSKATDWPGDDEKVARLKEYYEDQLAKRDEIIGQLRAIMRALNLTSPTEPVDK